MHCGIKQNRTIGMMQLDKIKTRTFLFLIFTYILIFVFKGFEYASNDVVDVMSYARYLQDNSLFKHDFYIGNIILSMPNERIFFSSFLSFIGDGLKWIPFVLHMIFTLFFLFGLYKISNLFIKSESLKWLLILVLLGPLYKYNLGGNELFYNMFISSYIAKVFGVWSVFFFLKLKKWKSFLLLIISTLLHPTVGSQLFIVFFLFEVYELVKKGKFELKKELPIFVYLLIAGTYIFLLLNSINRVGVDNQKYFEIFEFRNAHHFFPQYFPVKSYIVEISLYLLGLYSMYRLGFNKLLVFSFIIILGTFVYVFGVLVLEIPFILSTQWFKSTIWLELFSLIAIMALFETIIIKYLSSFVENIAFYGIVVLVILFSVLAIVRIDYFKQKPYRIAYGVDLSAEEDIAIKVKSLTKKDDIFIYPIEFTGFKYYSERSAFVDFKSVVHRRDALGEWYKRIKGIYKIDITSRQSGDNIFEIAKRNFIKFDEGDIDRFKKLGIEYLVQYSDVNLALPIVIENSEYKVYKL